MRLIDADRLLSDRMKGKYYHLPNGDTAIPIIDIEHAPTVSKWVSVKDRLPENAGIYIICDHYGNVMSRHFCKSHGKFAGYWHFNGSAKYGNPLYWMPLPEPPGEDEDD